MAPAPHPGAPVEDKFHAGSSPSTPSISLKAESDIEEMVGRVTKTCGKILQKKERLGEHGLRAVFEDTEGNRIALHRGN